MDAAALSRPTGKGSEWSPGSLGAFFPSFSFLRAILGQVLEPYLMGIIRNWGVGQPLEDSTNIPKCY